MSYDVDFEYVDLVNRVIWEGVRKPNRTGVDTLSVFNHNYRLDMDDGFPLLTTKSISWKNIVAENLWFLSGAPTIDFLKRHGCKFWDAWADAGGRVPSAYGNFWRHFPIHDEKWQKIQRLATVGPVSEEDLVHTGWNDQIKWVTEELIRNPMSRRMVVSAWAPGNAQTSKLPPCHAMFILNVQNEDGGDGKELCLHLTQRSCDVALGVPYNIAGYAFLLHLFARFAGIKPRYFGHSLVDAHIYTSKVDGSMAEYDHVPGLKQQVERSPRTLPKLIIDDRIKSLKDVEDFITSGASTEEMLATFKLAGYDPHPAINFKVAV